MIVVCLDIAHYDGKSKQKIQIHQIKTREFLYRKDFSKDYYWQLQLQITIRNGDKKTSTQLFTIAIVQWVQILTNY